METTENLFRAVDRISSSGNKQDSVLPIRSPNLNRRYKEIDPFLYIEQTGPVYIHPGEQSHADYQPNKGIEILTYLLDGQMQYNDSRENTALLRAGDVQLVNTAKGLLHAESLERSWCEKGGILHALQIAINLPKNKKFTYPTYQRIPSYQLPTLSLENAIIKVLAGEWNGERSPICTQAEVLLLHLRLEAGAETQVSIPSSYQSSLYVLQGCGLFGEKRMEAKEGNLVLFHRGTENIYLKSTQHMPLEAILISGVPIEEDIVSFGPFVMNTADEVHEAMIEYSSGQMESL